MHENTYLERAFGHCLIWPLKPRVGFLIAARYKMPLVQRAWADSNIEACREVNYPVFASPPYPPVIRELRVNCRKMSLLRTVGMGNFFRRGEGKDQTPKNWSLA